MKKNNLPVCLLTALVLLLPALSKAQLVGADLFIKGDYVEIGVGTGGWYGSGAAGPAGYHGRAPGPRVGFVSDPDKDGWGVGVPDYCGDYFIPGVPQEGWDLQVGKLWGKAWLSSGLTGGITGNNVAITSTATETRGIWEGAFAGLAIRQTTILKKDKLYFLIKVTMKNTTGADITDIYYDRTLDPDNTSTMNPSGVVPGIVTSSGPTTKNKIEFKRPNAQSKSLVSAIGELTVVKPTSPDTVDYPVYLGIGSKDCRAQPYILQSGLMPGTNDSPSRIFKNDQRLNGLFNVGDSNRTDCATGLIFNIERIKPGDSTTFFMAYVLSTADLDSAFADMAPVFQYGSKEYESGDTIKLCRDKTAPDERKDLNIKGGGEYSWTWTPKPGLKNLTGTANEILLTNTPITYVVTPSETFGCLDSMVITVMPYINPEPPTVTSPVTYCRYATAVPLEAKGLPGAALKYYTVATGGTSVPILTPNTNVDGSFTFYVSQLNGVCESSRTPIAVTVNRIPDLDSITSSDPTFCGGKDGWIKFKSDRPNASYSVFYDKKGTPEGPVKITSDANGFITITGLGRADYTSLYIVNEFGCISNTFFGPVSLKGPVAVPPIVGNNGPLCIGDLAELFTTKKDSTTYLWTGPDGYSSTEHNPDFIATATSGGVYSLITTKKACESDPVTTTLVINPSPVLPKLVDQALCEGENLLVNIFPEPNTEYAWSGGGDRYRNNTTVLSRNNVLVNYAGKYMLIATSENGCSAADSFNLAIDERIRLSHSADTTICLNDTISLFAYTNTSSVLWSPTIAMNDSSSKSPRVSPSQTITYTVLAKSDHNSCPDTSGQVQVRVVPTPSVSGYDTLVRMNIPYTIMPAYGPDVVKWKWSPADSLSCSDCPNPTFNSNREMSYVVYGTNQEGCTGSGKVTVRVFCDGANITMPNAFTPNNDGTNDIFYVRGTGFTVKSFSIYNRLGQKVFSRENFNPNDRQYGWDGTFGGQSVSDAGGYVYMLEAICFNSSNEPILIKGTVLMIK